CHPIDSLKDEFEIEAKLQLADHNTRRFVAPQRHQIATADFSLHGEAEGLKEALHGRVKRCFPPDMLDARDLLMRHCCTAGLENRTVTGRSGSLFMAWTVAPT